MVSMSIESIGCNSNSATNFNEYFKDLTWVNEDYPDANMALLEGIRIGMTGYLEDKIIESQAANRLQNQIKEQGPGETKRISPENHDTSVNMAMMEQVLFETKNLPETPGSNSRSSSPNETLKRNSALTVRPTIGEERRAWLLEVQQAYCIDDQENIKSSASSSEMLYRNVTAMERQLEALSLNKGGSEQTSASSSCTVIEANAEPVRQQKNERMSVKSSTVVMHKMRQDAGSPDSVHEQDSCEFLFQHVEGCFKPSKIRLSPRIEKLDKLIPKTSKEFINTMKIVSTISPQPSEEQLNTIQIMHRAERSDEMVLPQQLLPCCDLNDDYDPNGTLGGDSDEMNEGSIDEGSEPHRPSSICSDGDVSSGTRLPGNACRSYKEVCIYGHSSTTASPDQPSEKAMNMNGTGNNSCSHNQSIPTPGFPSLPKIVKSGGGVNEEGHKSAPPLYSSILQRSPNCTQGCGDNCRDNSHQTVQNVSTGSGKSKVKKSSPASSSGATTSPRSPSAVGMGTFDCGFCRTNNEDEKVYRSHPLRINDIVVCPSLRKYVCCFCGATGDKAHTIKYCPQNPIGFFAKKQNRNIPSLPPTTEKGASKCLSFCSEFSSQQPSPEKARESFKESESSPLTIDHESKSDSECVINLDDSFEPVKQRASGNWIEAKTKGRKKKSGK